MTKAEWKSRIRFATEEVGTYRPSFDYVIDTLADILEKRDEVQHEYEKDGSRPIITQTITARVAGQRNARHKIKNPILQVLCELDSQALTYWRDLGLTPAGLKKITDMSLQNSASKMGSLAEALNELVQEHSN